MLGHTEQYWAIIYNIGCVRNVIDVHLFVSRAYGYTWNHDSQHTPVIYASEIIDHFMYRCVGHACKIIMRTIVSVFIFDYHWFFQLFYILLHLLSLSLLFFYFVYFFYFIFFFVCIFYLLLLLPCASSCPKQCLVWDFRCCLA